MHRTEDEKMAVVIQALTGSTQGDYFYPAVSGVAQSYNFYPMAHMQPREGIAHIALGLGKIVVEGGTSLRFSPKYPQFLPQCSTVDDILNNISGVGVMIETTTENFKADPSQGSHFFHNITSLGISYLTTAQNGKDFIKWEWLQSLPTVKETTYLKHLRLETPLTIKIDGKTSSAVIIP